MRNKRLMKFMSFTLVFALIISLLPLAGVSAEENRVSSTIYWEDVRQEIDGFGASGAFQQPRHLMDFPEPQRSEILELLFSTTEGAGLSIVRSVVGDGGIDEWGNAIDGPTPTIWPEEDGDFVWTGDEDQVWMINQAKEYGVDKFISTVWSPPAWMKVNNSVIYGGEVREDKYQQYADYLSAYIRGYKEHHDIDITHISLANEPNLPTSYSSSIWSGDQFRKFIKENLTPTFEEDEISAQVVLGEHMHFTEEPAVAALEDPETRDRIDVVAAHAYGGDRGLHATFPTAKKYDKKIWQTEASNLGANDPTITDGVYWAKLLHHHMTVAEANAWFYWWLVSFKDNGEPLINLDIENDTYNVNKRLFTIGNFSRFVRPGYHRIQTSSPGEGIYVSAYRDLKTGEYAVVTINENDVDYKADLSFDGHNASYVTDSVTPYRTSETEDMDQLSDISVEDGSFTADLPANSVTTFVGEAEELSSSVLAPIKTDEENSFKQGKAVPVKFELKTSDGDFITNAAAKLFVVEMTEGVEEEAKAKGNANQGNLFRSAGDNYIFNWDTKPLSKGSYQLRIDIGGHTVEIIEVELE